MANDETRLNSTFTDQTYARGLNANVGDELRCCTPDEHSTMLCRQPAGNTACASHRSTGRRAENVWDRSEHIFDNTHPWNFRPKNPIGYEMLEVSRVRVVQAGEISVMDIIQDRTEVQPGDYILPLSDKGYDSTFYPHAMENIPDPT